MSQTNSKLKEKIDNIYGCDENILNYLIKSDGSFDYTPKKKSIFSTENNA